MKILLAVDGSACSDAAVETVISRVRPEGAEVRVLHAVEWLKEVPDSYRFGEGPVSGRDILDLKKKCFDDAGVMVNRVADRLRSAGFSTSTSTPDDDARHAIVQAATEWPADLVVLGSHGRRGVDRFLLGSVAESVVRHVPCSVEIVRERHAQGRGPRLSGTVL